MVRFCPFLGEGRLRLCSDTMGKEDGRLFCAFTCGYVCDCVDVYVERGVCERAGKQSDVFRTARNADGVLDV